MTERPDPPESGQSYEFPPLDSMPTPPDAYGPVDYPASYPPGYPPMPPPVYPPQLPGAAGYPYAPYPSGYPGYGNPYEPYRQGDPYDPYRQGKPPGTNSKSIAALVTSLAGLLFCGLPSIAGIILGIMAMRETKRTGQDGHGMAVAGVVIGSVVVALVVLYIVVVAVFAISSGPSNSL